MARPSLKVLRIASVIDGLVCDELHQHAPGPVTAGRAVESDLLLFGSRTPKTHVLFAYQEGAYVLDLPLRASGRLITRGKSVDIAGLWRKQLRARPNARSLRVRVDPSTRGVVELGETTLLFQFAAPAPVPPKDPFPPELRARPSTMWSRADMTTMLAALLLLGPYFHWAASKEIDYSIAPEIDERFLVKMGLRDAKKPEEKKEEKKDDEEEILKQEDDKPKPKEEVILADKQLEKKFSKEAINKARGVGIARVLGTYGGDGPGTVFDVIQSTENNLGELFAAGMTATVLPDGTEVTGAFVPGGEGISAQGAIVGTKGFEAQGPELEGLEKKERKINSSVKSSGADVFGDADKKAVQATIRQRTGALQACYNKALQTNPGLAGKIAYTITISVMGTVTDVRIGEDTLQDPGVQQCTVAKIKGWRFPTTPGAEQASDVSFSVVFSGGS